MFLNFLTTAEEQEFFLKFAYLLAVAEQESSLDQIPTCAWDDNPEKGEYSFEEFAPGFAMKTNELLMLRKIAEQMGIALSPLSSRFSRVSFFEGTIMPIPIVDISIWPITISTNTLEKVARISSVTGMLKETMNEMGHCDRSAVLKFVLTALMIRAQASSFSMTVKKTVLFEALAMTCADDTFSRYEEELILYFCEFCHLDKEYIAEFQTITKKLSTLYAESLELITE